MVEHPYIKILKRQHYAFVGEHTAIKICDYTKKSIRGGEPCYKEKFYGIQAHRCIQMSPAINFCNLDCIFCWRDRNNWNPTSIDEPKNIIKDSINAQNKQLVGFKGNPDANKIKFEESQKPLHFAISLSGEPLAYPKISEFVKYIEKEGMTSFVVTNGMYPEVIEKMHPPTQLYISISGFEKDNFELLDRPLINDGWHRLMKSLDIMKELKYKTRTTLRITLVKNLNMECPEKYAALINRANATFVEVKGYSWIGGSRKRLKASNMPNMQEVEFFAGKIANYAGYKIIDSQESARVFLLMKEDFDGRIMDFSDK